MHPETPPEIPRPGQTAVFKTISVSYKASALDITDNQGRVVICFGQGDDHIWLSLSQEHAKYLIAAINTTLEASETFKKNAN